MRVIEKSELVMADRWNCYCFTKAYFMHTFGNKFGQSKQSWGSRLANCFIDRLWKIERGIWKNSTVVGARERTDRRFLYGWQTGKKIHPRFAHTVLIRSDRGVYTSPFPLSGARCSRWHPLPRRSPHLLRKYSRRSFNIWPRPTMPGKSSGNGAF